MRPLFGLTVLLVVLLAHSAAGDAPADTSRGAAPQAEAVRGLDRYTAEKPGPGPSIAPVRGIVNALVRERNLPALSVWDLLKDWLRSLLPQNPGRSISWLDRLLRQVGTAAGVLTLVMYGLLLAVAGMVLVFVFRELHAAGVFARRRAPASRTASDGSDAALEAEGLLDAVPPADQPAIVLRLLVAGLSRHGRLPAERHLTHRELIGCAEFDHDTQRTRFARVALLAEGLLYGGREPRLTASIDEVLVDARALLSEIERAGAAA